MLSPITIDILGTPVKICSVHCALAAILTLKLQHPNQHTSTLWDYTFCLATLLGRWSVTIAPGLSETKNRSRGHSKQPTVVCVMCVADRGKNFWVFGTAKAGLQGGGRKGLLEAWKQARKQGLDCAIGNYPFRTGGQITVTVGEAIEQPNILYNEGLVDGGEWGEEIIGKWLEAARELPGDMGGVDNTVNQKYGDCAETVPITVIMQNYKGDVLSIALCPKELKDIKSISEDFKPILRSPKEHTGAKRACVNCLMLFAASEVNSGMKLKFYEDLGAWSMRGAHYQDRGREQD